LPNPPARPEPVEGRAITPIHQPTPRYYDDVEPGTFPHQRALCRSLAETAFALEEPDANPLTLRLVSARTAIESLQTDLRDPIAAQQHLQAFFTAYCSALDRLTQEAARLHDQPDTPWQKRGERPWPPALNAWLTGLHASALDVAFEYQGNSLPSRLEDGRHPRLWIGTSPGGEHIDAVQLCRVLMRDGLAFMNATYALLLTTLQERGLPPWR
jgi:hypothetical protein